MQLQDDFDKVYLSAERKGKEDEQVNQKSDDEPTKIELQEESGVQSPQSQKVCKNIFNDIEQSQEGGLSERVKKESDKKEPLTLEVLKFDESEEQVDEDENDNGGPDPTPPEHSGVEVGAASIGKHSGSK